MQGEMERCPENWKSWNWIRTSERAGGPTHPTQRPAVVGWQQPRVSRAPGTGNGFLISASLC